MPTNNFLHVNGSGFGYQSLFQMFRHFLVCNNDKMLIIQELYVGNLGLLPITHYPKIKILEAKMLYNLDTF